MDTDSDDAPASGEEEPNGSRLVEPLDTWVRALSLVLGLAATAFGCYAVLASENQAGTAFVLLAGILLLLLGLQGTPLRRLGSGEHSLELADIRRHRAALSVISRVTREEDPEVAAAVVDAVQTIEPTGGFARSHALIYERAVAEAIQRIGGIARQEHEGPSGHYDIVAELPSGLVKIEVKYKQRGPLPLRDVLVTQDWARRESEVGWLLVTNAPLSGEVRLYNQDDAASPQGLEVVTWNDERDDDLLSRALARRAR